MERRRAREAHYDAALLAARGPPGRRGGPIHLVEDGACALEEGGPGVSELNPSRLATEQLNFELLFEGSDLEAERRLLNTQPLGSPGHMTFFGHSDEVSEVA
jgi:hypothetical protein